MHQGVEQAVIVSQESMKPHPVATQIAFFNADGTPYVFDSNSTLEQAAAQADLAALTSAAAAGATPTKTEFDKVVVDLAAARTVINSLLAKLRAAELIDT